MEDTPVQFILPGYRKTIRRVVTEETIIEEPLPTPASGPSPVDGPGITPRPVPSLVSVPQREESEAAAPPPSSRAWEKSQAMAARQYWLARLGELPHHLPLHLVEFVRDWGLKRLEMAFDEVLLASPNGTPRHRYQVLLRIFRQWRKAAGQPDEGGNVDGDNEG